MRRVLSIICLITLLAVPAVAETVEREFQVRSGGLLEFDLETGGTIKIIGWGRETVTVSAIIDGDDADIVKLTVKETSGGVLVATEYRAKRGRTSTSIEFEVRVPSVFDVKIDSTQSSIDSHISANLQQLGSCADSKMPLGVCRGTKTHYSYHRQKGT